MNDLTNDDNKHVKSDNMLHDEEGKTSPDKIEQLGKKAMLHSMVEILKNNNPANDKEMKSDDVEKHTKSLGNKETVASYRPGAIRTFKADLQELVQKNKLSLAKMTAMESDKKRTRKHYIAKEKKAFNIAAFVFVISLIFFFGAVGLSYYFFKRNVASNLTVPANSNLSNVATSLLDGIFFVEDRVRIDITSKSKLYALNILAAARDSNQIKGVPGNMIEFELVEKNENGIYKRKNIQEVINKFYSNPPQVFLESLKQPYMLGIHMTDKSRNPFFVFQGGSYHYLFSAMLNWEDNMAEDIGVFIDPKYNPQKFSTKPIGDFKDVLSANNNLRVLQDESGNIRMLYGFADNNTVIITNSVKTFLEISKRIKISEKNKK